MNPFDIETVKQLVFARLQLDFDFYNQKALDTYKEDESQWRQQAIWARDNGKVIPSPPKPPLVMRVVRGNDGWPVMSQGPDTVCPTPTPISPLPPPPDPSKLVIKVGRELFTDSKGVVWYQALEGDNVMDGQEVSYQGIKLVKLITPWGGIYHTL